MYGNLKGGSNLSCRELWDREDPQGFPKSEWEARPSTTRGRPVIASAHPQDGAWPSFSLGKFLQRKYSEPVSSGSALDDRGTQSAVVREARNGTARRPLRGMWWAVNTLILKGELILSQFYGSMPTFLFMFICAFMLQPQSALSATEGVWPGEPETRSIQPLQRQFADPRSRAHDHQVICHPRCDVRNSGQCLFFLPSILRAIIVIHFTSSLICGYCFCFKHSFIF